MKTKLAFFFSLLVTSVSIAQVVGKQFPTMTTTTVDNQTVVLPNDKQDKFTLVGLAYSKKSEKDLSTWFDAVYHKFIKKDGGGVFGGFSYDVNTYFVPMFTGVNSAATGAAKKKAAKNLDPRLLPHILFYKGKLKPYKESLGFEKKDVPYLFVIDKSGKIAYATSGKYTDGKMDAVEEAIDD